MIPITPPVFCTPIDAAVTTAAAGRAVAGTSLSVASAAPFGTPTSSNPVRLTIVRSGVFIVNLKATAVTGNTFTVSVADGDIDATVNSGDTVWVAGSAGMVADLNSAINSVLVPAINQLVAEQVPAGGSTGQVLAKSSGTDYEMTWSTPSAGGVTSVASLTGIVSTSALEAALGLGTAAYQPTTAFDTTGAAAAAQTASLQKTSNLSDLASASTARTNLGLGTAATFASSAFQASGSYSPLAGSASITILGTIASGIWQGSIIAAAYIPTTLPIKVKTTAAYSITYASSFTIDFSQSDLQYVTLAGNPAITFTNASVGQVLRLLIVQDSTGSRIPTWPTLQGTTPTLSTGAGKRDFLIITVLPDSTYIMVAAEQNF